jgi:hypothetical protein
MARLRAVCTAIRDEIRTIIPNTHYPFPGNIPTNQLTVVVFGGTGDMISRGGSEQEWLETVRVALYVGTQDSPSSIGLLDEQIERIADLFDADSVVNHTLNGLVDFCKFVHYDLSEVPEYANQLYYGGTILLSVKRRRFAGEA